MTTDYGRCRKRPALPMNRAVFHRLGLTVGIAIAVAGCRDQAQHDNKPAWRECVDLRNHEAFRFDANKAVAEGKLLFGDPAIIITDTDGFRRQLDLKGIKCRTVASGMSAGTAETQSGSGQSPPARPEGDAQPPSSRIKS